MTGATLFSGIGAPEVAMPEWDWLWHAEVEKFACAVMAERNPSSVNLGDVDSETFVERAAAIGRPDAIVFGSPCQSYSVAGKRLGLDDPRGNLALIALGIVARLKPRWFVFENVPGLFSSWSGGKDGRESSDFASFLSGVGESGYQCAWSVLDAQYFGLAQRRERVFVVGHFDWRRAAAVLLEPASLCGYSAPRREAGEDVAGGIAKSVRTRSGGIDREDMHTLIPDKSLPRISLCLNAGGMGRIDAESETLIAHTLTKRHSSGEDGTGRGTPLVPAIAFDARQSDVIQYGEKTGPLDTDGSSMGVLAHGVRRLTPTECERLQGFCDGHTSVTYRGKPASDGARYKAIGNSMAVPVVRWILSRIEQVDAIS